MIPHAIGRRSCLAALAVAGLALFTPAAADERAASGAPAEPVRVVVETTHGSFTIELYPELAPRTVARFLERAEGGGATAGASPVPYAGLQVCESRPHGHLILGCQPPEDPAAKPRAPRAEPPLPDEIDAVEMGLDERILTDPARIDWLWQQEIYPRYRQLKARGEPIPDGLRRLVSAIHERGPEAASRASSAFRWTSPTCPASRSSSNRYDSPELRRRA
jgi:hypothetical protein